jgi:predicted dehydrogenase
MRQGEFLRIGPGDGVKMPTYDLNYLKSVNYDMWQGPVSERPFNPNRFHYNWHWFWNYGNGEIGNQGPHQLDMARWGLNKKEHPVKIYSIGGDFVFDSDQQTPNTQITTYEYADGKILEFEVRGLYTNTEEKVGIGNFFYGSKGWMCIKDNTWQTYFGRNNEPGPGSSTAEEFANPMDPAGSGGIQHCENFISTLRSGNKQNLSCNIETGYVSTVLSLLGNISYRLGHEVIFDGAKERFVSDEEADKMLTDQYRKPYIVPEKV